MKAKRHIVGTRFNDEEIDQLNKRLKKEHLDYLSTLVRKATFWYLEHMEKQDKKFNDK